MTSTSITTVGDLKLLLGIHEHEDALFSVEIPNQLQKTLFVVYHTTVGSNQLLYALVVSEAPYLDYKDRYDIFMEIKSSPVVKTSLSNFYLTHYPNIIQASHIPFFGYVLKNENPYIDDDGKYPRHSEVTIDTMRGDKLLIDVGEIIYVGNEVNETFMKEVGLSMCDETNTFVITNKVKISNDQVSILTDKEAAVDIDSLPIWMDIAKQAYVLCRLYEHDQIQKGNTSIKQKKQWSELSPESKQIVAMSASKIYKDGVAHSSNAFVRNSLGNKTDVMVLFETACLELITKNMDLIINASGVDIPKPIEVIEQL